MELVESSGLARLFDVRSNLEDSHEEFVSKIRWIIHLRYVVVFGVLATMLFTGWQGLTLQPDLTRDSLRAAVITGAVACGLNLAYWLRLRSTQNLAGFVVLQLALDVVLFSSFVYRTGGVTSPFAFLFFLPIIGAAMLVSGMAAMTIATFATICYSNLALLGALGIVDHISYFVELDQFASKWSYVVLMTLVNPLAFFAVGGLTTMLMNAVRAKNKKLETAHVRLDRRAKFLAMLYDLSRAAARTQDSRDVLDAVGKILLDGLSLDRCLAYVVSDDGSQLLLEKQFRHERLAAQTRDGMKVEIPLREGAGLTARCALERRAENVQDPRNHPDIDRDLAERIGINPFAVAPMVAGGELLGILGIDRSADLGVIDEEAFELFVAFADQAATALQRARLEVKTTQAERERTSPHHSG